MLAVNMMRMRPLVYGVGEMSELVESDGHRRDRRSASGHDKDAGNQNYCKNELESLKNEYPQGLEGCHDKQHDDKQDGESCQ
jgi:hypothetical protein